MIYLNICHGDEEFADATRNLLFFNAFRWSEAVSCQNNVVKSAFMPFYEDRLEAYKTFF